ncbi:MAG: Flavin-dependent oxidoreductase, luciferase family [Chloroflexi bacterium]|jgi:probable F420-dependent oxidoreductase|nr:MAG: Flavin-dependent oxidoreductase, luciferase family [Chloroflexota bacterium]
MVSFGVTIFATDYSIQPVPLAKALEERGFDSVFVTEHTHIPASRTSPWPGGADLPPEYWHTHDPFVALGAMAAVTENLKLGTGITLIPERDPILMAKVVASLDFISNGRVLLGIGAGWNAEEMGNHGTAFADRWKVTKERILAMREIWNNEEAEFHGDFVNFDKIWAHPKPVQEGGPPILIGADTKWAYPRVVDYADGWFPIYGRNDLAQSMAQMRAVADEAGRDMATIQTGVFGVPAREEIVSELTEIGFERIAFRLPSETEAEIMPRLDKYAALIASMS